MKEMFALWVYGSNLMFTAQISYLLCSDSKAQVDHEDSAVMDLIRSDDWVQSEHPLLRSLCRLNCIIKGSKMLYLFLYFHFVILCL